MRIAHMAGFGRPAALAACVAVAGSLAAPAAAETAIKGASCFPKGSYFSKRFEGFVADVNAAGTEGMRIDYLGGAPAIGSPFTLVQKATKGVYGVVSCTGAYYQNVLPEADALKMTELTHEEMRENGAVDYLNKLHAPKNLFYLARIVGYTPFHLYLNRKIDGPDLTGLHLRVAPIYTAFFQSLGATTQRSNIAQVYTYMENGTVHGYGWPITGILPDWHKVTKYRVDPGFYNADIHLLVNLAAWKGLSAGQRETLQRIGLKYEGLARNYIDEVAKARVAQDGKGIEAIVFAGEARRKWLTAAREAGWASIVKRSPEHGPRLRKLFTRE